MKSYNILRIIFLLLLNEKISIKMLAEELEVSTRTVKRYLATISALDLPLETISGKNGGIVFDKEAFYKKYDVTRKDIEYIIDAFYANNSLSILFEGGYPNFSEILKKIRINKYLEIDFSKWLYIAEDDENFLIIKRSILGSKQISFEYYDMFNRPSFRLIDPYKIAFKESDWYVLGWCHLRADYRVFKIRKMRNVQILETSFIRDGSIDFDFHSYFEKSEKVLLRMLVSSCAAAKVYEDFDNAEIHKQGEAFLVESTRINNPNLLALVMSYGKNARVLSPKELIDKIVNNTETMEKIYKGDTSCPDEVI